MAGQGNQIRLPAGGNRFLSSRNLDTTQRVQVSLSQRVKWPVREAMYSHTSNVKGKIHGVMPPYPQTHSWNKYDAHVKIYHKNLASYTYTGINDTNKAEE